MKKMNYTIKAVAAIAAVLLAVNLVLGGVLLRQSKRALKTLIDERMLDISNTAADMIDGDILERLTAADEGTAAYQSVYDALAVFQRNIDLEYIYTVREDADGSFIFIIDPAEENASEYGDIVHYTEALGAAGRGTPAVDSDSYQDEYGRFYSAYSPVFDSRGSVAGIVAVDFSADWYEHEIARRSSTIIISTAISVLIGVLIVVMITARFRRRFRELNGELGGLIRDVEELTSEFSSQREEEPPASADSEMAALSDTIRRMQREVRAYVTNTHRQADSMITALGSDYRSVYYLDLDKDEGICYQSLADIDNGLRVGQHFAYLDEVTRYAESCVTEEYREGFLQFIRPDAIRAGLEKERLITHLYMVHRNGVESYEMVRIAGVRHPEDRDDHIVHAVGMGFTDVDVETRKALAQSEALRSALCAAEEANRAKTTFLSNMSHEIRTPMNAIIGLDTIALADPDVPEKTREYLEKIGASAQHLLGIINDILDMSRIESGRMTVNNEEFSFAKALEQVNTIIGGQCREKGLRYDCRILGPAEEYYIGDDMKLRQVLINILGNAVKFTPAGGEVSFTVEQTAKYDGRATIRFVIRDTGIGMSEEYLPKIFETFSQEDSSATNRYGSTGLGMPITKSLVELMNGNIAVESKKGVGSTFTVTVTLGVSDRHGGEESDITPRPAGEDTLTGRRILMAEDMPVNAEIMMMVLSMRGMEAELAENGRIAVEKFAAHGAGYYDAILMDMRMPEMDGLEATKTIRAMNRPDAKTIPIIALTANAFDEDVQRSMQAGLNAHLSKPVEPEALYAALESLIP